LKVLVSAYACNPYKGSEEGVGWGWIKAIAAYHDLHVLTAAYHQADVEQALAENADLARCVRFHFVPHRFWHYRPTPLWRRIEGSCLKPIMNRAYRFWQKDAYRLGRQLHEKVGFDLVHQLTYVGFRFPGHLWKLNVPFVWGPIGGMENTPWRLLPMMGMRGCILFAGRNIINSLHKRFLQAPKKAFQKAAGIGAVIAATSGIQREIKKWYGVKSQVICEVGPPPEVATDVTIRRPGEPLRIAWSGIHEPRKSLPLLLGALAQLPPKVDWRLDILGRGSCTSRWQMLSRHLGLDDRCLWHGWLHRDEGVALLRQSHVFVITSIQDLTSTVLLEALSQGVPVVCLDHCGFRDVLTGNCGIKVPVTHRELIEMGLAEAITSLGVDETLRMKLAEGALARITDFSWGEKAQTVSGIYRRSVADWTKNGGG
jgi:glycosyltransferase involved in cell wall biosynthesis